ncbi:riboflavin synthase [Haloferax volcanii]|uniref:Riboflavin synthase n=4 Tax=Haloferax TaxID=2251 RepID=A0A6C0UR07_HALVO|nr:MULTISPECIES: riboflavin synthase [Haloferax]ELK53852.1 riboflavin synthase subunit alpha [Haloferax sp. BAB-2207]ELZ70730.1 riboflavin synthase subunit alpha [Haloferax lucentense DSM 14919]ELZ90505.1 riboflavin synthase subunit alpha [Haloferax alexandrinus JCM 10717]NLV01385.1 riboflavin synthase [Haloferax alexandrinus]QIB77013.1 riboflavin synthase [Haloferax alexandrinus]
MFTGIVEGPGEIVAVTDTDGGRRLRIRTDLAFDDLHHGQSIAVSGVCLTVEAFGDDWFEVFLAAETVEKTYLGDAVEGDRVNLERALAADDRFDGHIVQGHVDGTTTVTNVERVGDDWFFEFDLPESLANYVVQKGSVCLDGISLTVADRREGTFAVAIIPTTYDLTTLSEKAVGDPIHVEVDVVAKYVESMLDGYAERLVVE